MSDMDVDEEFMIHSSVGQFDGFIASSLYKDFCTELDVRIDRLIAKLEDENLEHNGRYYDLLRGGIKNMRQMKGIFQDLMHGKETQDEYGVAKD